MAKVTWGAGQTLTGVLEFRCELHADDAIGLSLSNINTKYLPGS